MNTVPLVYSRYLFQSVHFSHSVMSDTLWPHEPQHARPPRPSPTPRVQPNPCPLSRWCHPTISSSVVPFSSYLQSFAASGSFQMSQLSASGGQRIGVSTSTSVLPMTTQDWSPLGWTGWTSLQSKGLSRVFSSTTVQKHQFFGHSAFFRVQLSHPYMTTGKTMALNYREGLRKEKTTRCRCPQRFEEKPPSHSLTQFPPSRRKTCFCQIWGPRKSPVKIIPSFLFGLNEVSHTKPKYSSFLVLS